MSERNKILAKIKKCLALSSSSNEHEAEAALRQARALMEKHGIDDDDMLAYEASEQRAKSGAKTKPVSYENSLACKVADAFGCRIIFITAPLWNSQGHWSFIGCGVAPEIASYAFQVLYRQCKRARTEHINTKLKRCKTATKTRRADLFCEGWMYAVSGKIAALAENERQTAAIDAYVAKHFPALKSLDSRNRNDGRKLRDHEYDDYIMGGHAGKNVELNRGVGGTEQARLGAHERPNQTLPPAGRYRQRLGIQEPAGLER